MFMSSSGARVMRDLLKRLRGDDPDDTDPDRARDRARDRLGRIEWPAVLTDVLARLSAGGGRAYLVGGTVRDALLGRASHRVYDVATDTRPEEVVARFPRVEPIGIRHGTVLILEGGIEVESTTFRREGEYPDARHPERVEF